MEMVDSWCNGAEDGKIGSIRSILQAFRKACHYGEDQGGNLAAKFSVMSGSVLDKVMHFVLKHMDRILRELLGAPSFGGKKEAISELMITKSWRQHGNLMRIYLGNALHMITEMTDEQMIAFTIHRVRASAVFLVAFPALLRKYVKVRCLHFLFYHLHLQLLSASALLSCSCTEFFICLNFHAPIIGFAAYLG
jgi:nucleolar complex protein 2